MITYGALNEIYNIGANTECANSEVIKKILALYHGGDYTDTWQNYVLLTKRSGQDLRYSVDDSKLRSLGWNPEADFDQELPLVVNYYKNNFIW